MSQTPRSKAPLAASSGQRHPLRFPSIFLALSLLVATVGALSPAAAQSGCTESGRNTECNQFGYIGMETQYDIRGDAVNVPVDIYLETVFREHEANWVMISMRNVTDDLSNPIMIQFEGLETPHGKVETEKVEQPGPNELSIWLHVLDTPVDVPLRLDTVIGSSEQGAFRLEVLVMVFDRAYEPIVLPNGSEAALYSFSLLGVNKATEKLETGSSGSESRLRALPAPGAALIAGSILGLVAIAMRRRDA